jgi:hypothetical protein
MFGRSPEENQQAAYRSSPVGLAEAALHEGKRFFQLQLPVSQLNGPESEYGSSDNSITSAGADPEILARIEDLGWRLDHVGYVFIETGSTSTDRMVSTFQGTVTRGQVHGVYLFRNSRSATVPGAPQA